MSGSHGYKKGMILEDARGHQRQVAAVTDEEPSWVFFTSGEKLRAYEVHNTMKEAATAPNPNDRGPE